MEVISEIFRIGTSNRPDLAIIDKNVPGPGT
jgi:hypothetical protein